MKFNEIINEGRDAPLYHGVKIPGAGDIISADEIWAATQHENNTLNMTKSSNKVFPTLVFGVSLTRSKDVAFIFGDVVFEINQRRLAQSCKIIPVDYYWHAEKSQEVSPRNPEYKTDGDGRYESEEFCVGPINPLSRYLTAIIVKPDTLLKIKSLEQEYFEDTTVSTQIAVKKLRNLRNHYLLKIDGKFINQDY